MNAETALTRLKRMVQDDVEPSLSDADLHDLLTYAAVADSDGRRPDDDAWQPAYSAVWLNAAAAEGWRTKAAKLGAGETFTSDGASFDPQARRAFCLEMATTYQRRIAGSSRTPGRTAAADFIDDDLVLVN